MIALVLNLCVLGSIVSQQKSCPPGTCITVYVFLLAFCLVFCVILVLIMICESSTIDPFCSMNTLYISWVTP